MAQSDWLGLRKELSPQWKTGLMVTSFLLPLGLWCALSYLPWLWHPMVKVIDPGGVSYFQENMLVQKEVFQTEVKNSLSNNLLLPKGAPANPIFFPAPDRVLRAFYTAFITPPRLPTEPWLHESLWHSIQIIFWGFGLSSLIGWPLGMLCGTFRAASRVTEPFIEFFRYLPAPAFGALCVAVLGIHDAPKVAIIFIGTFFQQVLVIANTTRKLDPALIEAAQTLGAKKLYLIFKVVIPGTITDVYNDMRILLGWAWTYLIVAELIGTTSGITYFINQQGRYRNYDNVYAAIIMIGMIGLAVDLILAWIGRELFPWKRSGQVSMLGKFLKFAHPNTLK